MNDAYVIIINEQKWKTNKFKYLKNQSNEQYNINKYFSSTMKIAAKLIKVGYFFITVCKNVKMYI